MSRGHTGGSPGPKSEGTWYGIVMIILLSAAIGAAFLFLWRVLIDMGLIPAG